MPEVEWINPEIFWKALARVIEETRQAYELSPNSYTASAHSAACILQRHLREYWEAREKEGAPPW